MSPASSSASTPKRDSVRRSASRSARRMNSTSATAAQRAVAGQLVLQAQLDLASRRSRAAREASASRRARPRTPAWRSGRRRALGDRLGHPPAPGRGWTPRPPGRPARATPRSSSSRRAKPSMKLGQRVDVGPQPQRLRGRQRQRRRAALAPPHAVHLAHDLVDRRLDRVEEGPHLLHQPLVLRLPLVRERVVAPRAALRVLPLALRSGPRASSWRSSGYIVFGLTDSTPAVIAPIRSISWLP